MSDEPPRRAGPSLAAALAAAGRVETLETFGRVVAIRGLLVEVAGPVAAMRLGGRLDIEGAGRAGLIPCEVIGFSGERALAMPFGSLDGVRRGCPAYVRDEAAGAIRPSEGWLGRVVDALGRPIDGQGPLPQGPDIYPLRADPPPAHARRRVGGPLDLGVRCINTFLTMCAGQRMGIFAGSGVGKSVLLSMLARYTAADVAVIGLVGERGREVQEFLQDDLGEAGLARSVVVVATSDEPALMRRNAAYVTLSIAEHFRDRGAKVLCMIDSITRFAMAQRDIGLAAGEPPTAKGYTPTVFSELPRLLERAGPGAGEGTISALFTVLVEGDDHNEPVADAVRGILDGHIVMERAIAERGRYPAINVLRSVSRTMPRSCDPAFLPVVRRARRVLSTYADMEELIRLGAYRAGSSAEVDEAVALMPEMEAFLGQGKEEATSIGEGYERLAAIVGGP
ncbi:MULTISPECIES: flagellar protein export ATPase FliI [Methylobacterium]|uniref:Flagellum-specific ATP synthase n=1 Tax=Methylobacterium jeotgali TaxID=381630 RepID=A0ABQ4SVH4_9HYPH|nr:MULTISPECIES: flagellar protein export ATPase FliI [Methylobacterium]PIU07342.1 MAG: flagellum-specific ATP synthase FliI [Methylobacterium sp. CG09_land_8_20_14_0_10_71_15]PIU11959.1 MAG: flagellum-specific ATP synthase FliI [Methylobacterium sp. CG08_land_8_20_14_0_20_71_15]GBU16152.1 flagellum-specific ATP synthase [Methylobacterium sp.]GJE05913.1 putative ATP synthase YscN [Methylobacterium jeotgali]